MNYCLVEDGVITEGPRGLPKSWRNVSGLNLASDAELKEKGWLPYSDTLVTTGEYEVKLATTFVISADGVAGTENKRTMTTAEKDTQDSNNARDEIMRLETLETPRRLAESVLTAEGKTWLQSSRDAIAAERAKL
jgi:hypothetical protein|tara:strand:+ start:314 stop:718 length:405 start_codon:yes stop_codon:yes gene_type:complete